MRELSNRTSFVWRAVCALALWSMAAAPASAQPPVPGGQGGMGGMGGPFDGLFGGSGREEGQTLDFRASVFGAYDDSVLSQAPGTPPGLTGGESVALLDQRYRKPGFASGFNAALGYRANKRGARSQFQLTGEAAVTEFGAGLESGILWASTYDGRARVSKDLTPKTTFAFGAGGNYAPFYQYAPFLKDGNEASSVSPAYGLAVSSEWVSAFDVSAAITNRRTRKTSLSANAAWRLAQDGNLQANPFGSLSFEAPPVAITTLPAITAEWIETRDVLGSVLHNFTSRTSISTSVGWRDAQQMSGDRKGNVETKTAHAALTHNLTRRLSVHAGYALTQGRYSLVSDTPEDIYHTLDVGLGFADGLALTFAQRYTLSLSTDMSVVRNGDAGAVVAQGEGQQTAFRVNGSATLTRSIGRTWAASVGYLRATSYIVGFRQPFFSDSANAGIGGQIGPRLQFSAGTAFTNGELAFSSASDKLKSYSASTRLTYGLARFVGLYGQYAYYTYDIPAAFSTLPLPPTTRRRSASVGLSAWLPILGSRGQRGSQ